MKHTNINIDSLSYTNKDFRKVMEELLALVPELTSNWNPNDSNESDPGVALLKLKAFIADKLNYNIDKNVLETFPTSVTQRGNAQKLYDLLGYEMQWYRSATVPVVFKYVQGENQEEIKENANGFLYKIPKFTTLKDDTGSVVYTLLQDAIIEASGMSNTDTEILAMEGPIQTYTINGQEKITIQNLDSDYRLYFTESMVAQNGIFVSNDPNMQDLWTRVSNLETSDLNTKIYKFGVLPNSNTCYLEFPQDAANIFGGGIYIKYLVSTGAAGNIALGTLTKLQYSLMAKGGDTGVYYLKSDDSYSTTSDEIDLSLFTQVANYQSATDGENPESLDEAYRNYRRTIGTFNTLVTTKDYESAIYNSDTVSNAVVSDRTDDHNRSYRVKTFDINGKSESLVNLDPEDTTKTLMNAFNLVVYALDSVTGMNNADNYNTTFRTKTDTIKLAQNSIEECKSIQHDWIDNSTQTPFLYKNLYELSGKILTYQKVSSIEAKEIEQNVQKALYKQYNSRNLNFGESLIYEDIVKTVKYSDDRIKEFLLDEPNITTYSMTAQQNASGYNSTLQAKQLSDPEKIDIIAKSILAGVTPYCIFDDSIPLNFSMEPAVNYIEDNAGNFVENKQENGNYKLRDSEQSFINNIDSITTLVDVKISQDNTVASSEKVLGENETIQFYSPNFVTIKTLSTYLYVAFKTSADKKISKNTIYQLRPGEYVYAAENRNDLLELLGEQVQGTTAGLSTYIFEPGKIIKTSFDLPAYRGNAANIKNLETTNTIEVQEENLVILNDNEKVIKACWSLNDSTNQLFGTSDSPFRYFYYDDSTTKIDVKELDQIPSGKDAYIYSQRILKNGEYFIYTDFGKSFIALLTSGTRLKIQGLASNLIGKDWVCDLPNMADLNANGISADVEWEALGRGYDFSIQEMQIITLGQGAVLKFNTRKTGGKTLQLNNTPEKIDPSIISDLVYKVDEYSSTYLQIPTIDLNDSSSIDSDNNSWYGFSNLQLICSNDSAQKLKSNQYIVLTSGQASQIIGPDNSIKTNLPVALTGGINQSTAILSSNATENSKLSALIYKETKERNMDTTFWKAVSSISLAEDLRLNTNVENDIVQQPSGDDTTIISFKNTDTTDTNHNFIYEACINPVLEESIIPAVIQSDKTNSSSKIKLEARDKAGNFQTLKLELSGKECKELLPSSEVLFLKMIDQIYSNCSSKENTHADKNLRLTITGVQKDETITVTLHAPSKFKSYSEAATADVRDKIKNLTKINKEKLPAFDFTYRVDESISIEDPTDPESFFETNHIKNKFVISQIDTSKIGNISVAKQSRK